MKLFLSLLSGVLITLATSTGQALTSEGASPNPHVVGETKKEEVQLKKLPPEEKKTTTPSKEDEPKKKSPEPVAKAKEPPTPKEPSGDPKDKEVAKEPEKNEAKEPAKEAPKPWEEGIKKVQEQAALAEKKGDTGWILVSSALVMFMLPGVALFYGGMVRRKNVLATMMQSYAALAVVGVYWIAIGYALAFGPSVFKVSLMGVTDGGILGWHKDLVFLRGVEVTDYLPGYAIPIYVHVMFQGMFAIITPALISGAIAERIRFWPFCIFMIIWVTFVYCPLAHMVWAFDWFYDVPLDPDKGIGASAIGLLGKMGALDFAGGTVVHIAAGIAGLACALVLRKRTGYPEHTMHPNSMVLTLSGAGLLWFGWFGFNGGSALNGTGLAGSAFAATQAAAAAAGLSWVFVEWLFKGKPTALGMASGFVAGLVAVTPASGFVYMWGGMIIGLLAGVVCYFAVQLKNILKYDDSLDAFGVHAVGGFLGAVLTGVFCYASIQSASTDGFFAVREYTAKAQSLKPQIEALRKAVEGAAPKIAAVEAKISTVEAKLKANPDDDKLKEDLKTLKHQKLELEVPSGKLKKLEDAYTYAEARVASYQSNKRGPMTQTIIQLKAALFAAVYAMVLSFGIALLTQILTGGNFTTDRESEVTGLDQTEHGEVGFDFGTSFDTMPIATAAEPRAAKVPPGGKRFDIHVEGVQNGGLISEWSKMCQPSEAPADNDFLSVYPYVTTVQGNKFRLRGGDPTKLSVHLQKLFQKKFGPVVKTRVVEG